ncbi:tigger transposable element-derived protein 1 [Trichonephila clavata]|uniref:Tigger transposable element-derived protein 1 n=1 Tax=Trichonephila clavata TaxID=2740835 RepID=A0A8X6HB04_TRICU|nr:tigger transposable element-derived protein 1 [Trichonephila clavata]
MGPKTYGVSRAVLTINTKREMIAKVENGQKMADVARQYGLNRSTIKKPLRDKYCLKFQEFIEAEEYRPQQIFNCDQTGLFWKRMPNHTYITEDEKSVPGHKPMKDRLTLLFWETTLVVL